jgi:hypothetical protein
MIFARALAFALGATLCLPAAAPGSNRYDPRLRFRTIATPRFDIHFHQGEEAQARRLAEIAEEVAAKIDRTLGPATGRVHVILVDQTDLPNGWATPLPYNLIEISAAGPGGESIIGNTDDWLRLVFTHEYTHVVHLGRGAGWIGGLRSVFGRHPLLYPNLTLPLWQIEGIATFKESYLTGHGRLHAGDFRLIAERGAGTPEFLSLDRANGGLIDWPSGHAQYVYGGLFHEFLEKRYGSESLRHLTDDTARRLPYFGARAFRKVFDKPLGELWKEFEADAAAGSASPRDSRIAKRLTRHGFNVAGPRFARDGELYYSTSNPHGFPALMALAPGEHEPREVTWKYLGARVGFAGNELVFDQVELIQNVGLQSDLYLASPDGRGVRRLTKNARAADPDVAPDGRTIVCTVQHADRRALATLNVPAAGQLGTPAPLSAEPLTDWSSPRWSPDGRWIAAERRKLGGPSEIVLVDPASGSVRRLAASFDGRNVTPAWTKDGRQVLFAAHRMRAGFQIYSVDVAGGVLRRLNETGPNAHSPDVSPDGSELVYIGYTSDGYDLFSIPMSAAVWTQEVPERVPDVASPPESAAVETRAYSPWQTLTPRFWTPTLESDNDELVIGAATGGYDALGRHAFGVEAGWAPSRLRPDWQVAYAYDRWWPTLFADFSDDTDPFRDGEFRSREANAGAIFPVRRVRWSQQFLAAFHASSDSLTQPADDGIDEARAFRRSIRGGWLVDSARAYGYSISEEDGWSATVGVEFTREALGADGDAGAATLDARGYLPLGPRHAVFAARVAAGTAWGDEAARRVFSASGNGPQGRGFSFASDAIGLMRGVDESDVFGDHAAIVNIDYRLPLLRIERGFGTLPVFARTLHGALFLDAGHGWTDSFRRADIARSVGAELSLDAVLGYALPLTFTGGVAWRALPDRSGVVVFSRVGRAF